MRFRKPIAVLLLAFLVAPGCRTVSGVEQWKCDNWGMCHFGIKPSKMRSRSTNATPHGTRVPNESTNDCGCR